MFIFIIKWITSRTFCCGYQLYVLLISIFLKPEKLYTVFWARQAVAAESIDYFFNRTMFYLITKSFFLSNSLVDGGDFLVEAAASVAQTEKVT
jgi:hypothetical protein